MDNRLGSISQRCFDGDWMPTGSTFLLVASDYRVNALSYKTWASGIWTPSGLHSWDIYSGGTNNQRWIQVAGNPKNGHPYILVGSLDTSKNMYVTSWDGSGFSEQTLATTTALTMYDSFRIAFSYPP